MKLYDDLTRLRSTAEARWSYLILPALVSSTFIAFLCAFFEEKTQLWRYSGTHPRLQCAPDGLVHSNLWDVNLVTYYDNGGWAVPSPYNLSWDPALFISVTLGFGTFTFPVAKTIDVFWDLIVERGGQLLLVFLINPTIRLAVILV